MKSMKKAVVLMLCVGAIAAASVFGTMAYFTSQDVVENTFTVGNVTITLDEAKVNEYGKPVYDADPEEDKEQWEVIPEDNTAIKAPRVEENNYKLIPGATYTKDPTIHVAADSEDCWLFVKVENALEAVLINEETTLAGAKRLSIAEQLTANGWTAVTGATGIYQYKDIVSAGTSVTVFETFTVAGDGVDHADLAVYDKELEGDDPAIKVTAYAIQAHGFATAQQAWDAANDELK